MPIKPIQTILLLYDNDLLLRALHNYFENRGYNLLEARGAEEALLIAECHAGMIHVLVAMNGRELLPSLLPFRPDMQVIAIEKPLLPKRLLAAIAGVLADPLAERTVEARATRAVLPEESTAGARHTSGGAC